MDRPGIGPKQAGKLKHDLKRQSGKRELYIVKKRAELM